MDPSGRPIPAKRTVRRATAPGPPASPAGQPRRPGPPARPTAQPHDQPIYHLPINVFPRPVVPPRQAPPAQAPPAQAPPAQAPPAQAPPAQAPPDQPIYHLPINVFPRPIVPPRQAPLAQAPPAQAPPAQANTANTALSPGGVAGSSEGPIVPSRPAPPPPQRRLPPLPPGKPPLGHFDLTLSPIKLNRSATITEDPDTGSINLIDAPQGSTKSLAAFCESMSMLAVKFPHYEQEYNPGLVKAHLSRSPLALLGVDQLTFTVASDWDSCPIPFPTPLNKTVSNLIDAVAVMLDIPEDTRQYYLLKLCDSEEFLHRDEALGDHECIRRYHKFNQDVPLQLLHISNVNDSLARDAEDDKAPCHLYKYLGSTCAFAISRLSLQGLLNTYHREVNNLLRSQYGMNVTVLVEVVRTISSLLCGVSSQQLEEAVGMLNRIHGVTVQALVQLVQVVFDNFTSDFRGPVLGPVPALLRLEGFEHFSISCVLTHGGKKICGVSENISTALSLGNNIQCNRKMMFPVLVSKLPYESMLTFCLMGCKLGKNEEQLRWGFVPLFSCSTLVNGTVLLGMSMLAEPLGPPTPSLADSHQQPTGVILQLDFPSEFVLRYERPAVGPGARLFSDPCDELLKEMSTVSKKHCLCFLTMNECAFLWSKRYCASPVSTFLHLVLGGAPSWKPEDLPEIYKVVYNWPITTPEEALFLLSDRFHDATVRRAAVQFFDEISHGELELFLPQLVQALKNEWELDGALVMLLLDKSVSNIRIAQQLYWLLVDTQLDAHYQGWFSKVLAALKHCCGRALRKELERQAQLVVLLTQVAVAVRLADKTRHKEVLEREKWKITDFFSDGKTCRLPLDAAFHVKAVDVEACTFYNSNTAPLGITFISTDPRAEKISVICKTGDSMRQDRLIMQIVCVMDRVWLQEGLDMRMVTYRCLSTGKDQGLLEVVQDAVTLAQIQQEWGLAGALRQDTLEKWFHMGNKTEESYEKAVLNFLYSCAGWCVATFILGICDRHNDNIMLKHSGHMFHIDFGKIMGNAQMFANIKRDRVPFVFSSEMQHFITGGGQNPQRLHRFVELCCDAYNVIRRRSALVLSLLELMLGAGLPEMKDVSDLQYVQKKLRPHDSDLEATSYFTKEIKTSMESFAVKLNYLSHSLFQEKKAGAQAPSLNLAPGTSANIQEVVICKFTFKNNSVLYEMRVTIDDGYLNMEKTFGQFELIHKQLQKHFIESTLPQFPSWFQMPSTPARKMRLLNKYFNVLFNGPCKGNEFVCRLFLDGPKTSEERHGKGGSPQIQLFMSYTENKLSVMVKHLENIRTANGSNPDAYVVLRLIQDDRMPQKKKTKVVHNNNNPTFNELLQYLDVPLLDNTVLEVKVKSQKQLVAATSVQLGAPYMDKEKWLLLCNCF
ncbi:hypothetical protein NHX12_002692 [Muraenolepis orangiensis]|uniref:Phosphatidylinositol-4-phosphate 3-kinase n=1 Tax=Muraenolepis orangiensis TaxID=630683 RepID=A0A9Q0DZA7_9TELE|nr:hypothetical protein NHX12_002692 [Muraenolepis orangiensis]